MAEAEGERWDGRYRAGCHAERVPPAWLDELDPELPRSGRALDVAAGAGRVALWLARRGLDTTALDVSGEALRLCRANAASAGLSLSTLELDLENESLPAGPFDLISCFFYLQRDLFPALRERLAPGGCLVCELPTRRNLERHAKPGRRFLVETNELLALAAPLEVVYYREGWSDDHCVARLLARSG
ncbi:MAG: class I SAM-dependent methyltransferase [Myxococcota bacterium]